MIPMNSYNTYVCNDDECEACDVVRVEVICHYLDVV